MIKRKFCAQCRRSHRAAIELQEETVLTSSKAEQSKPGIPAQFEHPAYLEAVERVLAAC
jgi:hypothetical protein